MKEMYSFSPPAYKGMFILSSFILVAQLLLMGFWKNYSDIVFLLLFILPLGIWLMRISYIGMKTSISVSRDQILVQDYRKEDVCFSWEEIQAVHLICGGRSVFKPMILSLSPTSREQRKRALKAYEINPKIRQGDCLIFTVRSKDFLKIKTFLQDGITIQEEHRYF